MATEQAGRRILNFRNPTPGNTLGAARTLLHAYQLVLPGETAPSHRHTAHALRVILDGRRMYSVVNGEKSASGKVSAFSFFGDSQADEPAFRWVNDRHGVSVKVGSAGGSTNSAMQLPDTKAVRAVLTGISRFC